MPYFFTLLFIASMVLLVLGLFRPQTALFWKKSAATRKQSTLLYGVIMILMFAGIAVTVPPVPERSDNRDEMKETVVKDEKQDVVQPAAGENLSQREMLRALAKRCDTSYRFIDDSSQFDHDTGWVVAGDYKPWFGPNENLNQGKWEIPTYKLSEAEPYTEDNERKLQVYQKVWVRGGYKEKTKKLDRGYFKVSPIGSEEIYSLDINCFTLKDPAQCSLTEKAKNGFIVKASYSPPADPSKRAQGGGGVKGFHPVNVPSQATVLVLTYDPVQKWFFCYYYDRSGKELGTANFYESTLTEIQ